MEESKKHHRYEFPSDRATGSFTSKLIDVASIFEATHDCKFTNDSISRGLEIIRIFHEIRCFPSRSLWCFVTLPVGIFRDVNDSIYFLRVQQV